MEKLIDELAKMGGGQKIKIGAKSSFFYCGTVNEFCEKIDEYGDIMRHTAEKAAVRAEIHRKKHLNRPPTLTKYMEEESKQDIPDPTIDGWNKFVEAWFKECVDNEYEYRRLKAYVDGYVELAWREVKEIYNCSPAVDEDAKCVIIDGSENGKYWDFNDSKEKPFALIGGGEKDESV